ncbi:cupin domain-containing protein [cf. Phormidesmis sp. LEGE 11477]|uniref:cupin domain-containing protein n=1 Tax=cf. Phormidesmis sp. LEGE 11477 TaxID=1828680 RepID=UPI00187E1577|nr:cupin domain-containing protein [cf. Phormidesmis sp. LEGE 11477]MBE9059722.1 cupin domain-containing protein [cf. Phormidesmis sp. LEGE 11477]
MSTSSKQSTSKSTLKPTLSYWHVWTDDDGISHQTRCELTDFTQESMGGNAAPQWNNRLMSDDAEVLFATLPVAWVGEWHENPRPQWIVPISGVWYVETMDGDRVEMGPGEISFGADQNTQADAAGRKGHTSGCVGDQPAKLMVVQLKGDAYLAARPGDLS